MCTKIFAIALIIITSSAHAASTANETAAATSIWVVKNDQAKSCEKGSGIALSAMEKELKLAGIKVLQKKKIHDGKMHIEMCGAEKGTKNGYLIGKKDADKAVKGLGFQPVQSPLDMQH